MGRKNIYLEKEALVLRARRTHTTKFRERKCFLEKEALGFKGLLEDIKELEYQDPSSLSFL